MDGFWCSRCLNNRIEVPEMMGSFPGGSTTPLVVKSGTKQTWWKVGFFSSIHASQKLLYSLCFSTYMKMVNSTWFYGPSAKTLAHKVFISTTFVTQSFDLRFPIFFIFTHGKNCYFSYANYSIKHNINVLLYCILQIDVCLRIQNLKKNWKLVHKKRH